MKMQMVLTLVLGLAFLGCTVLGSSVKIDVTTQYHDGVIPNAFNIRCTSHPSIKECSVKAIISIQVTNHNGETIVNIQGADNISHSRIVESSITTEGHIDTDHSKTFLSVTINDAVAEDSGIYTCKLLYLDEWLQYQIVSASKNVTINNQNTQDIVRHLLSKISFLENLVQFQGRQFESYMITANQINQNLQLASEQLGHNVTSLETELAAQKAESVTREAKLQGRITLMANQIQFQEESLRRLDEKDNTTVLFKAVHTRTGSFPVGGTVIYGDVIDNVGAGYSGQTGVFTAPVSGYYLIHVSVISDPTKYIFLDLMSTNRGRLTKLLAGDTKWESYADTSCVVKLDAGHQVWPVIARVHTSFSVHGEVHQDPMSKFYGYLLKKL